MKKQLAATGFFLFSFMLPLKATALTFNQLYVFGDSLSDPGNVLLSSGGIVPQSPPYYQGRFSDGTNWVDDLDRQLGLNPVAYANAFIPGSPLPTDGINFAFGGATTGTTNTGNAFLPGLQTEIDLFKTTLGTGVANKDALYIVWAGSNDYLGGGVTNPTVPVSNISTTLKSLFDLGARNFLVANLPDLGKSPGGISQGPVASEALNQLTSAHNNGLSDALNQLNQTLNGVNIIPFDVDSLFNQVINSPGDYGFTNVTDSCLVSANPINLFVGPFASQCSNPDQYLFWDNLHPTAAANSLIANRAFQTLTNSQKSTPEASVELGILAIGALGAGSMLKRQGKKLAQLESKS